MSGQPDYLRESSSSSRSSYIQESEDDITIGSILAEANHNNAKNLGKRLSHLDSIPHTPRVNGQIPDVNNATLDHERLSERLSMYGLAEFHVEGDGNCQFRALADQLFHNPEYHKHVRKAVVKELKHFRERYEGYVPMDYKKYLKSMKRSGEWGDHLTLQAAADRFGAKICLLTSFRDTCFIEINPKEQSPTRELWLSFWSEVHYNSLYEADGIKFYNSCNPTLGTPACLDTVGTDLISICLLCRSPSKDTQKKALALLNTSHYSYFHFCQR